MIDLSNRAELALLGEIVAAIQTTMSGRAFFIAGAQARDLLLQHHHGINPGRGTRDIDIAVTVEDWKSFTALREALIAAGFIPVAGMPHRLRYGEIPIDIIPFGDVEREDRTISWPSPGDGALNTLGFREALARCESVRLPGGVEVSVASIPDQALLKLVAWGDRNRARGTKDAQDFRLLVKSYSRVVGPERLASQSQLFGREDFDADAAGAWLLGKDAAASASAGSVLYERVGAVLDREASASGSLTLVSSMGGYSVDDNLRLVQWFRDGLTGK